MNEFFVSSVTPEMIDGESCIGHIITEHEVERNDFTNIMKTLKVFMNAGKKGKDSLCISFYGYEDNPCEVYEILEIRNYVKLLFKKCPSLFYFLSGMDYTRNNIFLCLCDLQSIKRTSSINVQAIPSESLIREIIDGVLDYGEKVNDSNEELSKLLDEIFIGKAN